MPARARCAPRRAPTQRRSDQALARRRSAAPSPRPRRRFWPLAIAAFVWLALAAAGLVAWLAWDLPHPATALEATRRPGLTLLDRQGGVLARTGDLYGETVLPDRLPRHVSDAVIAIEDRRFYRHAGVDPIGIARAAWMNARHGRIVQGGSTLTQQVAKTLFLAPDRSLKRKGQELLLALWLERAYSKEEILGLWLNRVYFGAGAYGIDAAARLFFGVPASGLSVWQAAVLAGLPRAPSRLNPRADPEAAIRRGRVVLAAMVAADLLTREAARRAEAEASRGFAPAPPRGAGWFADWATDRLPRLPPEAGGDFVLRTTLDPGLQSAAERGLAGLLAAEGERAQVSQGAVVVLDAASGAVRAMVGGRDRQPGGFNRAVAARRQPGSAFKPFVWLAALEAGMTPDTWRDDRPIVLGSWRPENMDGRHRGSVRLGEALALSLNTVAAGLAAELGLARILDAASRAGIRSPQPRDATLVLGTGEVRLIELAAAYATLLNGGLRVEPYGIEQIESGGRIVWRHQGAPARVLPADRAAAMASMLREAVERGTGRAAAIPGRTVAGKTGTSQDFRDAWFVGAVDGLVIGIWLGNDDGMPMRGVSGGGLPARLFREIAVGGRAQP